MNRDPSTIKIPETFLEAFGVLLLVVDALSVWLGPALLRTWVFSQLLLLATCGSTFNQVLEEDTQGKLGLTGFCVGWVILFKVFGSLWDRLEDGAKGTRI